MSLAYQTQIELSYAYHIMGALGLDDHTYTHLSARSPDTPDHFYINAFGLRFEEVTAKNLLCIDLSGNLIGNSGSAHNKTGAVIHAGIYAARPDIQAIFHVHTPAIVAVASLEEGLQPLSQWALHFYNRVGYHAYDSLALALQQGHALAQDLGDHFVLLLRHHGALLCGRTIPEAMFYTYHLEQACQTQHMIQSMGRPLVSIPEAICESAVADLLSFEKDLGRRDWDAWKRWIQLKPSLQPHAVD